MAKWVDVCKAEEIFEGDCKVIEVDTVPIAVFKIAGLFYAIEDNCPHQHMPLADGEVTGTTITCPFHGAQFDITTGAVLAPPACEDLNTYTTRVENGVVQVNV